MKQKKNKWRKLRGGGGRKYGDNKWTGKKGRIRKNQACLAEDEKKNSKIAQHRRTERKEETFRCRTQRFFVQIECQEEEWEIKKGLFWLGQEAWRIKQASERFTLASHRACLGVAQHWFTSLWQVSTVLLAGTWCELHQPHGSPFQSNMYAWQSVH